MPELLPSIPQVFHQLVNTPDESNEYLELASQGAAIAAQPARFYFPLVEARSWADLVLSDEARFPPEVPFLAIPHELGRYDVVRARRSLDGMVVDLAEAVNVFSLRVTPCSGSVGSVAARLLRLGMRPGFRVLGATRDATIGDRDTTTVPRVSPDWPHWIDSLHWWRSADALGFISLKASGGPTRAVISADDDANMRWFPT
jgi:hypothetical protein